MNLSEIDSFYFKFKNLLIAEKDATLTLKSESGRGQVTLSVDLGHLLSRDGTHPPHHARNGPSRSRRRERRGEARLQAAAEAAKSSEEVDKSDANEITEQLKIVEQPFEAEEAISESNTEQVLTTVAEEVPDEFCSNQEYDEHPKVDDANDDTLVEEILATPDCQGGWKDEDVENIIEYNLKILGINMVKITRNRSNRGALTSCLVQIRPISWKKIEKLTLRNWSLKIMP